MVGQVLMELLSQRKFPVGTLLPFSSGSSSVKVRFLGKQIPSPAVCLESLHSADIVFMVSSDEVSKKYSRALSSSGIWVIDDSSAYRLAPDVPLVIPEVNPHSLSMDSRLIAGPNCTITGPAVAAYPIHRSANVTSIRLASYQAVSGAGRRALIEFYKDAKDISRSLSANNLFPRLFSKKALHLPRSIAFNVFPQVGSFDSEGDSGEELKVRAELRKIWSAPGIKVSATAVRVPVMRGHSIALWLETSKPLSPSRARALLRHAPGVRLWKSPGYPTPADAALTPPVHVGRIRRSGAADRELAMWVVSDNLLKGAALNSVHIAEFLLEKGWLRPKLRL